MRESICPSRVNVLLALYQKRLPSMTASSSVWPGLTQGLVRPLRRTITKKKKQQYLRTKIGALDAQLDTCRALKFGVLAAVFCLTLPSSFGARHAFVCRKGAAGQWRHTAHAHSGVVTLRSSVQWAETFLTQIYKMATAEPVSTYSWEHIQTFLQFRLCCNHKTRPRFMTQRDCRQQSSI